MFYVKFGGGGLRDVKFGGFAVKFGLAFFALYGMIVPTNDKE